MTHQSTIETSWQSVTTPFDEDLFDVVYTDAGPFAVGGSGTVVTNRGQGWEAALTTGPATKNRTLRAVATTENERRVWFAGASGAIGMYDTETRQVYDYSYAKDISSSWKAIAVSGPAGSESVLVSNGSGAILPFTVDGLEPSYGAPETPGSGSAIVALVSTSAGVGYAVESAGNVFTESPEGWTQIGIEATGASLTDVTVAPTGDIYVTAANGTLYRRGPTNKQWEAIEVTGSALRAVDIFEGHVAVLAANNTVYRRPVDGRTRWKEESTPTGNDLLALALGRPDVAVGKSGTVVERPRAEPKSPEPGEPKQSESADPRVGTCDILLAELVQRLSREELITVLEEGDACETTLVEHLESETESETTLKDVFAELDLTDGVPVVPVAATAHGTQHQSQHHTTHQHCKCECSESVGPLAAIEHRHKR